MEDGKLTYEEMERRVLELEGLLHKKDTSSSTEITLLNNDEYKNIIELSSDATLIANINGKVISWNKALVNITGINQPDAIGDYLWNLHYQFAVKEARTPDLKEKLKNRISRFIKEAVNGVKETYEQEIVCVDGERKTVRFSSTVLDSGKNKLFISSLRDITEDKNSEIAVIREKDAILKLNQFSIELSKISSGDNLETFITRQIKDLTGALGVTFSAYNPKNKTLTPRHIEMESELLDRIIIKVGKQVQNIHFVVNDFMYHGITKGSIDKYSSLTDATFGTVTPKVESLVQSILKADRYLGLSYVVENKLYGSSLIALSSDQSDPQMEILENFVRLAAVSLRRKRAEETASISEERLRTVTDNAADVIIELDRQGTILNTSRLFSGNKIEDVVGKNFCDWAAPEYHAVMKKSLESVFAKAIPQSFQSRALGFNNEICWYSSRLSPVKVGDKVVNAILIMSDITEQRNTEEALRESEENYKVITQSSLDVIFTFDKFGKLLFFNKSVEKILGYKVDEITGRMFVEFLPAEEISDSLSQLKNIFDNQKVFNINTQIYHKNGYLVDVEIIGQLVKLKGEFVGQGTIRDITKKKRAEEELKKSHDRYEALLGANPDMMFVFNSNCKIVDFHSESHDQLLVKPEDFLGKLVEDILPHEVVIITRQKVAQVLATGKADYSTYEMKIGKTLKYFESRYVPCGNSEVLSIVRDITERRLSEIELQLTKESYLDIFNSVSEAIYVLDESGTFIDVNEGAEKMYQCSKNDLIGKSQLAVSAPGLNNFEEIQTMMNDVTETGNTAFFDFWAARKNGEIFPSEVIVNRGKYFDKVVLIVTARDNTEKKEAEELMKYKNEELLNLNAEKDKFFSIVAHDLRSPFNSFMGLTQVMSEDLQNLSMAQIQNIALSMSKSATNLYALLENLLAWSRLQSGMTSFDPKSFILMAKVSEGIELVLEMAHRKGIETELDFQDDLIVFADQNMVESIIRNVALNAVKFTPKGGKITISAKLLGRNTVEISVRDTGIGMSKEILDKLFSIDQNSSRVGTEGEPSTGLGLLLSKDFINKHGGKIWAESEEGKGSVFYFTIPCVDFRKQENFSLYSQN